MDNRKKRRRSIKPKPESTIYCSFCGKGDAECESIIKADPATIPCTVRIQIGGGYDEMVGDGTATIAPCICGECVALCAEIVTRHKEGDAVSPDAAPNHKE